MPTFHQIYNKVSNILFEKLTLTSACLHVYVNLAFVLSRNAQFIDGENSQNIRVKSGEFGRSAKFGQRPCLFHILIIGIKNKITKQTVQILMRRLIRNSLIRIFTVCKCMSEFTCCPILPDFTLVRK